MKADPDIATRLRNKGRDFVLMCKAVGEEVHEEDLEFKAAADEIDRLLAEIATMRVELDRLRKERDEARHLAQRYRYQR